MPVRISVDGIIHFAEATAHLPHTTLTQEKPFRVRPQFGGITFIPSTGPDRPNNRDLIEKYVETFNEELDFATVPYVKAKLRNASYFLALVHEFLTTGGKVEIPPTPIQPSPKTTDLEQELMTFLTGSLKSSPVATRNAEIIAYFYGFRGESRPTLQSTATAFTHWESDNVPLERERIRQILNRHFRSTVKAADIPSCARTAELLSSMIPAPADQVLDALHAAGILKDRGSAAGILRLLHALEHARGVNLYQSDLSPAMRDDSVGNGELYFLESEQRDVLREPLRRLRVMPGQLGIANFFQFTTEFPALDTKQVIFLKRLVLALEHSWTFEDGNELWFMFEDRANTMVTYLEKIYAVTPHCPLDELAATLRNALDAKSLPQEYPSEIVIGAYLHQSRYIEVRSGVAHFKRDVLAKAELTEPESEVVRFLSARADFTSDFRSLLEHLLAHDVGPDNARRLITSSAMVHVDSSDGRGNYRYRLVGHAAGAPPDSTAEEQRYELFRERLRAVGTSGTDEPVESKIRREQPVLREWLFEGRTVAECAICGHAFDIEALVTAHKKPRADCDEAQRTDPNIVMPLCVFGCDFLYERGYLYVENGTIQLNGQKKPTERIRQQCSLVAGRAVTARWLRGPTGYFRPLAAGR